MSLAARGNISKVSSTAEVCTQEMDAAEYFKQFPPQAVVHAYGNVLKPDYSGTFHWPYGQGLRDKVK